MNKLPLFILIIFLLFSSCDKSLIQTKNYVGASKDILILHLGEPHLNMYNGEKGEILVYIVNKKREVDLPQSFDRDIYNYVVFLVDPDDIIYHTAKYFYNVSPPQMKNIMLQKYG